MSTIEVRTAVASPRQRRQQASQILFELAPVIEEMFESTSRAWLTHVHTAAETASRAQRKSLKASSAVFLALRENPMPADRQERIMELSCQRNELERVAESHDVLTSSLRRWTDLVVGEASNRGVQVGGRTFRAVSLRHAEAHVINPAATQELMQTCDTLWQRAKEIADTTAVELGFVVASPISGDEQARYRYARTLEARLSSDLASNDLKARVHEMTADKAWEARLMQLRPIAHKLVRAAEAFADLELANDILSDASEIFTPYFETEKGSAHRFQLGLDEYNATVAGIQLINIDHGVELDVGLA